jgi:ligand-binding SRPBCC domain-containing protein
VTRRHLLVREQLVPRPRPEVFAFFSDARNLEAITPAFLRFRIATPGGIAMAAGTVIDYRLSLFGIPFGWRSLIEAWEPLERFVDVQVRGPYRSWRHLHEFSDAPGGTLVRDRVEYELPAGPLGAAAHALFVRRSLARIFDHRARAISGLLAPGRPPAGRPRTAAAG